MSDWSVHQPCNNSSNSMQQYQTGGVKNHAGVTMKYLLKSRVALVITRPITRLFVHPVLQAYFLSFHSVMELKTWRCKMQHCNYVSNAVSRLLRLQLLAKFYSLPHLDGVYGALNQSTWVIFLRRWSIKRCRNHLEHQAPLLPLFWQSPGTIGSNAMSPSSIKMCSSGSRYGKAGQHFRSAILADGKATEHLPTNRNTI
jgi:hypothetical protein